MVTTTIPKSSPLVTEIPRNAIITRGIYPGDDINPGEDVFPSEDSVSTINVTTIEKKAKIITTIEREL